ncbi:MAG: glycosyltransferase family 4 protein [Candidatus Zixiibacteriota bacterium]|nr:MAG: glycosyltransferase family 4 protein [candidate division Zixibacteria bacterium]
MKADFEIDGQSTAAPLKVLFITHNYIRRVGDFAGVFLHLLARKLRENDIEVHVVAPHDAGLGEYEEIQGIKIYRFRYADDNKETFAYRGDMHRQLFKNPLKIFTLLRFIRSARELAASIIEKENIRIVSVHWLIPNGIVGRQLKRKFKDTVRLFLSSHGTDVRLLTGVPCVYGFLRSAIRGAQGWTVVSNYLRARILRKDRSVGEKIHVVPLPNDETVFYPDNSVLEDPNLIVAASRLTVQKRLNFLLRAVKIVFRDRPHVKLEIYGEGPERDRLEKMVTELGLSERVKILKPVSQKELRKAYSRAAIVVLNSVGEGFGLALTEAMLCRTAVIGTNSGGIVDIIENDKSGLLVPPDDPQKLADAIRRLLGDVSLRERLARAGYNRAIDRFSSQSSAKRYADLFRS